MSTLSRWVIYPTCFGMGLCLTLIVWWAAGPTLPPLSSDLPIHKLPQHTFAEKQNALGEHPSLTVMTYNIAHGQGIKHNPWDARARDYTMRKLRQLAGVLVGANADVVLLQEVDLHSARTGYIGQARFLAEQADYPYYACSVLWNKNYIPFPYWPPSRHLGRMLAANCVLSRYSIVAHARRVFAKPRSNPFWYNLGYIDRGAQRVHIRTGDRSIAVVNVHLEAFDKQARQEQVHDLTAWMQSIDGPWVLGGDFNAPPPEAAQKKDFHDESVDYTSDRTLELLRTGLGASCETFGELDETRSDLPTLTYPADRPNRRLDHVFASPHFVMTQTRVLREAGDASDHLPVLTRLRLSGFPQTETSQGSLEPMPGDDAAGKKQALP